MEKFLYYPIKPFRVNQAFADNQACVDGNSTLPVTKRKVVGKVNGVCPVGYVELYPLLGMKKGHTGLDLYGPRGFGIYASADGTVEEVNTEIERGLGIGIVTDKKYDMGAWGTHYAKYRNWHLQSIEVKLGQKVKAGDLLGTSDNTGVSAGDHDHFELKPVMYYPDEKSIYNVHQDNGWFGAIDPMPHFLDIHAVDVPQVITLQKMLIQLLENMLKLLKK